MKENGNCNMGSVVNAVATATITIHPFDLQIISTTVGVVAIIAEDLTRAEKMECRRKPEHVEDHKDSIWYDWKNNKSIDFANDFCSNLHTDVQKKNL